MKRWLTGFIAGVVFTVLVGLSIIWVYRTETLNLFSNLYGQRVVGETKVLLHDSLLYQDGKGIGKLKSGTRLLYRLQTESLEEFYLPIGWENGGKMDKFFYATRLYSLDRCSNRRFSKNTQEIPPSMYGLEKCQSTK